MRSEGTLEIAAPPERVFAALTDARGVSACAPQVEGIEILDPAHFRARVRTGVGAVKGVFALDVRFTEAVSPSRIVAETHGSGAGSRVDMVSGIELVRVDPIGTRVRWWADVTVSGLLATVGSRFLRGAAERSTHDVLECMKARIERAQSSAPVEIALGGAGQRPERAESRQREDERPGRGDASPGRADQREDLPPVGER